MRAILTHLCAATLLVLVANAAKSRAQPLYHFSDLGTLGGFNSQAWDVNDSGQVVGTSYLTGGMFLRAFRTTPNSQINPASDALGTLGALGDLPTAAYGINADGQVAGHSFDADGNDWPVRWDGSTIINLGALGSPIPNVPGRGQAFGINNHGQVIGWTIDSMGKKFGFRTSANSPINSTDTVGPPLLESFATSISTAGDTLVFVPPGSRGAVISNTYVNPAYLACISDNGTIVGVGYSSSRIFTIHASDVIAYQSNLELASSFHFLAGDLTENAFNWDFDVNDLGQVVRGRVGGSGGGSILHTGGSSYELTSLLDSPLPGGINLVATAINNVGQIVGYTSGSYTHAFLLTPVPEPSALPIAMSSILIIAVGCGMRRRFFPLGIHTASLGEIKARIGREPEIGGAQMRTRTHLK